MATKGTIFRQYRGYRLGYGPILRKRMLRIFVVSVIILYGVSLLNFLRADAGLGEIEHYSAKVDTESTIASGGGSTGWINISASADTGTTASTNGWIDSTNLTAGDRYLILASGAFTSAVSTSEEIGMRVTHGGTSFTESEDIAETDGTTGSGVRKKHYWWFTVWTAVSGQDLEMQFYRESTTNTTYIDDMTLVAINAEDMISNGDLQYDIDTAGGTLTTSYVSKAGLSWTPANNNDDWWIMSYTKLDGSGGLNQNHQGRLDVNGTVRGTFDIDEKKTPDVPQQQLGWAQQLPNSAVTADLELRESAADTEWDAAGIMALRLNLFESFDTYTNVGTTALTTDGVWVEIGGVEPDIQTSGNVYVIGGASQDESTGSNRAEVATRIQSGGSNIPTSSGVGGWQFANQDVFTHTVAGLLINESTGVKDYDMDASANNNSGFFGPGETEHRFMVAFSMELAGTPTEGPSVINQRGYIWENDDEDQSDGDSVDENSQLAAGDTALTDVRRGERLTLRTQLENTGSPHDSSNLSLFYDRNDGYWTKVEAYAEAQTADGTGCATVLFSCSLVQSVDNSGRYASIATSPVTGNPWMSYYGSGNDLWVAEYVGTGGDCDDTAWTCERVEATSAAGAYSEIEFDSNGKQWIVHTELSGDDVEIAEYVGSGGTGCDSARYTCEQIAATSLLRSTSMAIDQNNDPWVAFLDVTNEDLYVAEFVGSGGDCDSLLGGSDRWECTAIETTDAILGNDTSIAIDADNNPWISYREQGSGNLRVAEYVGSGGTGCDDSAWTCTTVWATSNVGDGSSIAFAPDGTAWVSTGDTNNHLNVAVYVGSGGNCDSTQGGSDAWDCTEVDNSGGDNNWTSMSFAPDGNAWVSYFQSSGADLRLARYVGSGGTGCTSSAWTCITIDSAVSGGQYNDLTFASNGDAYIAYYDNVNDDTKVARMARGGEILTSPGIAGASGNALSESHADMTSVNDTSNRDSADCVTGGAAWNNGLWTDNQIISGFSLPDGGTTAQCSEVAFVIDTVQAQFGQTYRFVVASEDDFNPANGAFRGPTTITEYPTITIQAEADYTERYSKTTYPRWPDCPDTSDLGCAPAFELAGNIDLGQKNDITFTPDGTAWMMAATNTGNDDVYSLEYVGSGGTGCTSDAWNCVEVWDTAGDLGGGGDIASSPDGSVWMAFFNDTDDSLWVAHRVGSGGSCVSHGGSAEWDCYEVDNTANNAGWSQRIAVNPDGVPSVVYREYFGSGIAGDMWIAEYVGSGGNCTSSAWNCYQVETLPNTSNEVGSDIAFDSKGKAYISYEDDSVGALMIAEYVGAGGTGCDTPIWNCYAVSNDASKYTQITIDNNDNPHIAAILGVSGSRLWHAEYVGSGGNCDSTGTGGSDAWNCTNIENSSTIIGNRIAIDSQGYIWIAYWDFSNTNMHYATTYPHVASACDGAGWRCELIDDGTSASQGQYRGLAISGNGDPWISYHNWEDGMLRVAKLHEPNIKPSADQFIGNVGNNGRSGDAQYRLTDGRSPRTAAEGDCNTRSQDLGYCGIAVQDEQYTILEAADEEDSLFVFSEKFDTNTEYPSARWVGRSNLAPSTSGESGDIIMEVYRHGSTDQWEIIGRNDSAADCDNVDCVVGGSSSVGSISDYYEADGSDYWAHFRVRQLNDASTAATFKTDVFQSGTGRTALLTQKAYIWENDDEDQTDGDSVDENTQLAAANTAISDVRRGQRLTLRFQVENNGIDFDDEFGLFYSSDDDDIWTRVEQDSRVETPTESGCSSVTYLSCTTVASTNSIGFDTQSAVHPGTGRTWVVYDDETSNDAMVAVYVGQGGTGCADDAWQCDAIATTNVVGEDMNIAFAQDGTAWVSFQDETNTNLMVANHVGEDGNCDDSYGGSDAWDCTAVITSGNVGLYNHIAVDGSGSPWVVYADETNQDTEIAQYVGSGGTGCASSAWTCYVLDDTTANMTGQASGIVFDSLNTAWVTYSNSTDQAARVAQYVGSGGTGCASGITEWTCTNVVVIDDNNPNTRIYIAPDGVPWIIGRLNENGSSTEAAWAAYYVGSGGNCDTLGGSDAWQCEDIDDQANEIYTTYGSLSFDPEGTPWTLLYEDVANTTDLVRRVGSGGSCSNTAWQCDAILTGQTNSNISASVAFDDRGTIVASYLRDSNDLGVTSTERRGDFTIASGLSGASGNSLLETHTDMTSTTDTTNRDDADCSTAGAVFVGGVWSDSDTVSATIPGAAVDPHCTEIAFTIDTSNAELGETYQFILATKDSADSSTYVWRAMESIEQYATLTISDVDTTQIGKGYYYNGDTDCDVDTGWTCQTIHSPTSLPSFGNFMDLAHGVDGKAWFIFHSSPADTITVAEFVGDSSGTGCDNNDWNCYVIDGTSGADVDAYMAIVTDASGTPHVAYRGRTSDVVYARYVGSGGTGCEDDRWTCQVVHATTQAVGQELDIAVTDDGETAWISYQFDGTFDDLYVATNGGGGNTCTGTDSNWICYQLDDSGTSVGKDSHITLDHDGNPWIKYEDEGVDEVIVAHFVGSGGTGCNNASEAWTCYVVDDAGGANGAFGGITVDGNGDIWIAYRHNSQGDTHAAKFVGSGGDCDSTRSGSDAWDCYEVVTAGSTAYESISTGPNGNPILAYVETGGDSIWKADFVGTGGTGCASSAWSCYEITTNTTVDQRIYIRGDAQGAAWILYEGDGDIRIAKESISFGTPEARTEVASIAHGSTSSLGLFKVDPGNILLSDTPPTCQNVSSGGYCGVFALDSEVDNIVAPHGTDPYFTAKIRVSSNTQVPGVGWTGVTDLAPSTSGVSGDLELQILSYGSPVQWETLATDTTSTDCTIKCTLSGVPSGTPSEYYESSGSEYYMNVRVIQRGSASAYTTLSTDAFLAISNESFLRHGQAFVEEVRVPFTW